MEASHWATIAGFLMCPGVAAINQCSRYLRTLTLWLVRWCRRRGLWQRLQRVWSDCREIEERMLRLRARRQLLSRYERTLLILVSAVELP